MKKIIRNGSLIFIIFLFGACLPLSIGIFSPNTVEAQVSTPTIPTNAATGQINPDSNAPLKDGAGQSYAGAPGTCGSFGSLFSGNTVGDCLKYAMSQIASWIMSIFFAPFLYVAGAVLNVSINETIVNMSSRISNMSGITAAWSALRDVANMFFIFILLYQAILTVVQASGANARKTITNVVIAALLINFSMFFTKVAIDASNIVTVGIYDQIVTSGGLNTGVTTGINGGLSAAIMRPLGIQGINSQDAIDAIQKSQGAAIFLNAIFGIIIMVIATVAFATMAFMLMARFVILILLIILSPLAFVGGIIPGTQNYAKQWTETLSGQLIFAPVFMLMLWITLRILTNSALSNTTAASASFGSFASVATDAPKIGVLTTIFNYCIVIAFLYATIIISKQVSTRGGGTAATIMNKMAGWGSRAASGAMGRTYGAAGGAIGYGARRTIGKMDESYSKKLRERQAAPERSFIGRKLYGAAASVSEKSAKSSYDVRNTSLGKSLNMGQGQKGGFVQYKKDKEEEKKGFDAINKKVEIRDNINDGITAAAEFEKLNESILAAGRTANATEQAQLTALETRMNKARRTIQTLNDKNIEDLGDKLENAFIARNMSAQKFSGVMKNANISEARKEKTKKLRYENIYQNIDKLDETNEAIRTAGNPTTGPLIVKRDQLELEVRKATSGLTSQDLEFVDAGFNNKASKKEIFATNLSQGVYENALKADNATLSAAEKAELSQSRNAAAYKSVEELADVNRRIAAAGNPTTGPLIVERDAIDKRMKESVSRVSAQDIEYAEPKYRTDETFVANLSKKTFEDVTKPEYTGLTSTAKTEIANTKLDPIRKKLDPTIPATYNQAEAFRTISSLDLDTLAKLDPVHLGNDGIVQAYTERRLKDLAPKLDTAKRRAIRDAIIRVARAPRPVGAAPLPAVFMKMANWIETGNGLLMYS